MFHYQLLVLEIEEELLEVYTDKKGIIKPILSMPIKSRCGFKTTGSNRKKFANKKRKPEATVTHQTRTSLLNKK